MGAHVDQKGRRQRGCVQADDDLADRLVLGEGLHLGTPAPIRDGMAANGHPLNVPARVAAPVADGGARLERRLDGHLVQRLPPEALPEQCATRGDVMAQMVAELDDDADLFREDRREG